MTVNGATNDVSSIQSTYQSITDLQADFVQSTYVAVLEKAIQEKGVFLMKKPGKLRIEYTGEHPKQYISNGKKLWIVDPELDQVETHNVSGDSIPKEALQFLNGFGEMEKLFVVTKWTTTKRLADRTYLMLTPKAISVQYKKLECEFGPDNILKSMRIHNKSGNISTYTFNNVKINMGLDDLLFTLKK